MSLEDRKLEEIKRAFSSQRLGKYTRSFDNLQNLKLAAKRYQLDIQLSQAFYPALHIVEITLRNQVYEAIKSYLGDKWLLQNKPSNELFRNTERDKIKECIDKLKRKKKFVEIPDLIAELNFGYWTSLFTAHYEPLWRKDKLLKKAFPNLPKYNLKRKSISVELNTVRNLRNRIFHYEPIWHWSDLPKHHERIVKLIQWMNNEAFNLLKEIDSFPVIFKTARKEILKKSSGK